MTLTHLFLIYGYGLFCFVTGILWKTNQVAHAARRPERSK